MVKGRQYSELLRRARETVTSDPAMAGRIEASTDAAKPVIAELENNGYSIKSLSELRHSEKPWRTAIPILLYWLKAIADVDVKEDIVRCLSVPWSGLEVTSALIEEFRRSAPNNQLYGWTLGNALSIVNVSGFEDQLLELSRDSRFGMSRQMIVLGLGRVKSEQAEEVALRLLDDNDVRLHAIQALGKLRSRRALPQLEKLLSHNDSTIRREARKAITKITK